MTNRRAISRVLLPLAVLGVVLAVWWAVTAAGLVPPLYLPGPIDVVRALVRAESCRLVDEAGARYECGIYGYFLWEHLLASLRRILVGVGLGAVAGVLVGLVLSTSRLLLTALGPYLDFLRALPPLGYIGLLIVWAGMGDASKYWLLFLAAFPPVVLATIDGVRGVTEDRIGAARSLGANRTQVLVHVLLPSALPSVLGGIRLATGFAWTTVVAAELDNGIPGIGGTAYQAGQQVEVATVIGCILVIGLVAVLLDRLLVLLSDLLVPWRGHAT